MKYFMFLGGKKNFIFGCLISLVLAAFFIVLPVLAQDYGFENINSLPESDLIDVVNRIIKIALSLLGIIAVGFIIYGGVVWMTAGGSPEKIRKAKAIIANALIGLIIILLSYSIAYFIINKLESATNTGGGGGNGGGGGPWPSSQFQIKGIETTFTKPGDYANNVYLCSNIQTRFNHWVKKESVDEADTSGSLKIIEKIGDLESKTQGHWYTIGNTVIFKHLSKFEGIPTFNANTAYQIIFPKSISNTGTPPKFLRACTASGGCQETDTAFIWNFKTGSESDTLAPYVVSTYPISDNSKDNYPDQNVSRAPVIDVNFSEAVDVTTIMQESLPPYPISENIKIEKLDKQGGIAAETLSSNIFEVESKEKGFRLSLIDPNLLESWTWYRITAKNIADLCNNPMAEAKVWEFQTNDKAPGIQSWYPTGDKVCPDTAINISFNTTMYNSEVKISITGGGAILSATLPAAANLVPPYSISNNSGTFSVKDPADPINNKFRVFEFVPKNSLSVDTDYLVEVTTNLKTSGVATLSKEWNFHIATAEDCVCSPYINQLSPNQGPKGQCITISGYCFKGTQNQLAFPTEIKFDNTSAQIEDFDKNYITTTLPNYFNKGDKPKGQVTIIYNNPSLRSLSSNLVDFYVDSDKQANGPCIWSLNPNKGKQGQAVKISGIRFGLGGGTNDKVKFHFNVEAQTTAWVDKNINTSVPVGALDGDVTVTTVQGISNGVPFDIIGQLGDPCDGNINNAFCDPNNLACAGELVCSPLTCKCVDMGTGVCGDNKIDQPNSQGIVEQCDDGNTTSGDGCDSFCRIEGINTFCDGDKSTPDVCDINNNICTSINSQLFCDASSDCTCQYLAPSAVAVIETNPLSEETNVCRNVLISATFNQLMDNRSFKDNIILTQEGTKISGNISSYNQDSNNDQKVDQTVLILSPSNLLGSNLTYQVLIKGGLSGVKSREGFAMNNNYNWSFAVGSVICQIKKVNIIVEPPGEISSNDLFRCAGKNDCSDDQDTSLSGNQHRYIAQALDKDNQPLSASYFWEEQQDMGTNLLSLSSNSINNPLITAPNKNGDTILQVQAQSQSANSTPNVGVDRIDVQIFVCENSWPSLTDFPYKDSDTNFSTFYCRDGKTLLPDFDSKVVIPGKDDLIKEFLFKKIGEKDAIGIRVMKNLKKLSPLSWYQKNMPNPSSVQTLTVDGYEAVREGRTVYVNAANVIGDKVYTNIYLISYSEGASTSTIEIFSQMLNNWRFNINLLDLADKEKLNHDLIRWGDKNEISDLLEIYKNKYGYYPKLESGSYLKGISTSKWPSWQDTLSKELGQALPVDPINKFGDCSVPPGYNPDTCWNEQTKQFAGTIPDDVPFGTHVYFYRSLNNGQGYTIDVLPEYGKDCNSDECEDEGKCYSLGSCHPTQSLVYCRIGSRQAVWRSSCGNNIVDCGEQCDSEQRNYCDAVLGERDWYNEPKYQGCLAPGDENQCKWNPQQVYTEDDCGGWCGNQQLNSSEQCDVGSQNGVFCNPPYNSNCTYCTSNCVNKTLIGAYCGDNNPNSGYEQCDNGSNNGKVCTPPYNQNFPMYCSYCDTGCKIVPVKGGYCGDWIKNGPEQCDNKDGKGNGTGPNDQYLCLSCHWTGGWCGNGNIVGETQFGEQCDNKENNGKECTPAYGKTCSYCSSFCKTIQKTGPYCGDGKVDSPYEQCESGDCCSLCQFKPLGDVCQTNKKCDGQGNCLTPVLKTWLQTTYDDFKAGSYNDKIDLETQKGEIILKKDKINVNLAEYNGASNVIGDNLRDNSIGQQFKVKYDGEITEVKIGYNYDGQPDGLEYIVEIRADNNDQMSQKLKEGIFKLYKSSPPIIYYYINPWELSSPLPVQQGKKYWLYIRGTGGTSDSFLSWKRWTGNPYPEGIAFNSSSGYVNNLDYYFTIKGTVQGYQSGGEFISQVKDTGITSPLYESLGLTGGGTNNMEFYTRVSSDGVSWDDWQKFNYPKISSLPKRFIQWKLILNTNDILYTPELDHVRISWYELQ